MGGRQVAEEQEQRFWEWCKFERLPTGKQHYHFEATVKVMDWLAPDGAIMPYLPQVDLNSLFRWAVPKLLEEYNIEYYSFKQADNWYYSEVCVWKRGSTKHGYEVLHDRLIAKHYEEGASLEEITALALFWAVLEVIDKEQASPETQ